MTALLLVLGALLGQADEDFVVLSGPSSPRVAYRLDRTPQALRIDLRVEADDAIPVSASVGLSASRKVVLTERDAAAERARGAVLLRFVVPEATLVAKADDWKRLRLAFAVAWGGGPLGQDRQRERFRHSDRRAPHAGLSPNDADWLPLDLEEYELARADRRNRLWIDLKQPAAGKASVVIEDEAGRRVRNLVSGRPFEAGSHRVEWDGLDEAGQLAPPGSYRWRSVQHPGLAPQYLFSFANDGAPPWRNGSGTDMWGPDHSVLLAAAAGTEWTFLGGCCAESGYAIVAVDASGTKRQHYHPVSGTGIERVELAADGEFLYAAHDGFTWGQKVDKKKPDWKAVQQLTLSRFNLRDGHAVDFPGGRKYAVLDRVEVGPGSARKDERGVSLAGLALSGGRLFVSARARDAVLVVDPKTGEVLSRHAVPEPGPIAAAGDGLLVASAGGVARLDPASGALKPLVPAGAVDVRGIAADAGGTVYVSDGKSHQVKVFDRAGSPLRSLGAPGGDYAGPYQPERMVLPSGLALAPNGWLWVTEERWLPKRTVAWDLATGKIAKEKFGPTAYGASGAGFDPRDPSRWVGQGALWKVDLEKKTATPTAILGPIFGGGMHVRFHHQEGRTFLLSLGGVSSVAELRPDGSIRNLAFCGSTHRYTHDCHEHPPQAFVDAFAKAFPDRKGKHEQKGPGVLWVDRNGDNVMQVDEFDFTTDPGVKDFSGAYWGEDLLDLTFQVLTRLDNKVVRVALAPRGWSASGVPTYPTLNEACRAAVAVDLPHSGPETMVDRFGTLIANADPALKAFAPDGRTLWTYPNRWAGVHGSHNAPLPETGVLQGALFFLGMAPLDDKSDVFVMNGNHGRFFVLTSDGLYLDEMFKDVRMGASLDASLIGGECFGGFFGRSERDGRYYLQSGHTDYRIFRIDGLERVTRAGGAIAVTPAHVAAAEGRRKRAAAEATAPREALVARGRAEKVSAQWDRQGQFPARVWASFDDENLHLRYEVQDASPWVNKGRDWTMLFKTGDSVDLQLGSDPAAPPARSQPASGDLRLLIAPFEGKDVAVLYRHRLPGATDPVTFTCPWRSEKVDSVRRLDAAKITVTRDRDRYTVEATIRLSDLGLSDPSGKTLRGDFGVIYGDPDGTVNMLRSYWSNTATGLVNDVPGEIMLSPHLWGTLRFGGRP
jgi:hypothetical protein